MINIRRPWAPVFSSDIIMTRTLYLSKAGSLGCPNDFAIFSTSLFSTWPLLFYTWVFCLDRKVCVQARASLLSAKLLKWIYAKSMLEKTTKIKITQLKVYWYIALCISHWRDFSIKSSCKSISSKVTWRCIVSVHSYSHRTCWNWLYVWNS